ncbi:hypothetical protein ABT369_47085 [Dactylosporangium sp. NPDC000244]|uniref:nSTAND1 domain-containing NTPase n=1 Tax=Dactylosporangium sp. NPDC000244 TaxID=3154365 RepID=UPI003331B128
MTLAYARACGGDPQDWEDRWRALAARPYAEAGTGEAERDAEDERRCPYVGLAAFQAEDADRFFGREQLTEDLVARVRTRRFLAVFGASGSGKSSLLRAGLLPALRSGPVPGAGGWPALVLTPGPHPLDELAVRVADLGGTPAADLVRELRREPRALHLAVLQALVRQRAEQDLVLVVDQFEEVFTLCADPAERAAFITGLVTAAGAANSRTRVVLGVRADFYPACSEYPDLVDALRDAQVLVGPMSTDELRRAISLPAARAGYAVDSGLLSRVIADATGQAGVLPSVSHALRETWRRRRGNTLTLAGYEAAGGIQHALANSAETVYHRMDAGQRALTRGIFLRLVALGAGTEDTKRRVSRIELAADEPNRHGLEILAQARLITLDAESVQITHEALLHAWPRLRGWINEDRAGLLLGQQLLDAAQAWERDHRDHSLLYRGSRLEAAAEWAQRRTHEPLLTGKAREFLAASLRQQRHASLARRTALAGLAVLTVLACVTSVVAFQQRSTARTQRDRAVAEQVLAEADLVRGSDPSLAAQLDLAADRIRPTPRAVTALLDTGNTALSTPLAGHTAAVYAVAFSPDEHLMATGAGDDTIRLWDVTDAAHRVALGAPITGHTSWVYWLAFSPDGRTLASAGRDHTIRLWDVTDPRHPRPWGPPLTGHSSYAFSVSFSPDGHTLVSAGYDQTVRLWDVTDPAHASALGPPLLGHTGSVASAAYSPDGRTVASAGHDHTIRLWNVTDPRRPQPWGPPLSGHADTVYAVAFSPDSRTLASVSADRTVRLWDIADPARPVALGSPLAGHTDAILAVAFSHDGHTLATGAADHTVRVWDVTDPAHATALGPPLLGHTGIVNWLVFSSSDATLASVSDDHTVRLWNLPRTVLANPGGTVNDLAFRPPDGRILASAGGDGTVRLWHLSHPGNRPTPLPQSLSGAVSRVAFRPPDGRILASASDDHTVRLWDLSEPARPVPAGSIATGATAPAGALAFSPDGAVLATDGPGNTLRLWDMSDPDRPAPLGQPLTGQISPATWAGFSPDGRVLAGVSSDDKVRLWDVRDPAQPHPLGTIATGDTDGLLHAAFDPAGHLLATAGAGHSVGLWDLRDPTHPRALAPPLTGHTAAVTWVGFSPDGRTLASTAADQTVRLWDVTDPAHAAPIGKPLTAGHTGPVTSAAYQPGGGVLATAGDDRTIQFTDFDLDKAIQRVCATTVLSAQQWQQYVPDRPLAPPCR